MDRIRIEGGRRLDGTITISGAKNAALAVMPACLLTDGPLVLTNVPRLMDIESMITLLAQHGALVEDAFAPHPNTASGTADGGATRRLTLRAATIASATAPYDIVRKMRASVLVLGPLLARHGHARVSLPGGCAIGTRPVDLHLKALEALGAEITLEGGYIDARAPAGGLRGAEIVFPTVTVGGTENALMAAVLAQGETVIENAAREPEITDLATCLTAMGAHIEGIGTNTLRIQGVTALHGAEHAILPDRIESGTYALAAAITRGRIRLQGTRADLLQAVIETLEETGVTVTPEADGFTVDARDRTLRGVDVMTKPFPGFPTDMQAQWMALMATAEGASMITENIFENRFMHVPELARMGADINIHGGSAIVRGRAHLSGAEVMATDLRASVCLVLAALAAEGETVVNRVYHLDRGYETVEAKLAACGAAIERLRA
ncbi:UDP-N-acetylglucosamine 1-carboxyvinyltransferase [Roseospira marina]|uniref:UDP-N-acetylglucosamine 1-carboxyvinyltransferase n=1 Tax=Roseospira marina TaxID=140057 RepID=A0A5M6I7W1_9PROT|nr:UDP-N-acetylglucosamine 1-carboxyvinyltransferase [Roseospira marina]KAA5603977.1 UDP-N-acetylglucosamine 1-carboxyvinyltransferase [Roseospira marina]MBB4315951.1 UDP-N-acetylglucosamine 1-carboxyvinyltransferase [Roseospira marina]MBB5089088.1 UDP-N-acetylglucosamine 1-carboxyvinyltransferase [Roseospira marina]